MANQTTPPVAAAPSRQEQLATPFNVKCVKSLQCGFEILSGVCKCGKHISVNGPGSLVCSCGQSLVFAE